MALIAFLGSRPGFLLLAALTIAAYGSLGWYTHERGSAIDLGLLMPFLPLLALPSLVVAVSLVRKAAAVSLSTIFVVGVLLRAVFLGHDPLLSDDVYRYLWDGRVQVAAGQPYGIAPADPRLDHVEELWDDHVRELVNHPEIPTVYPPLLQLLYAGVAHVGGGLVLWRVVLLLFDMGIAVVMVRALRSRGRNPCWVVLYLWHPLPIIETFWSAHAEGVAVFFLLVAVTALQLGRGIVGAVALALGGVAKLLPFGLVPFLVRRFGWTMVLIVGLAALVPMIPYVDVDWSAATEGLDKYAEGWYFNDVLYRFLGYAIGIDPEDRTLTSTQILRKSMQAAWVVVCLWAAWRLRDPFRAALWVTAAFVVLTPTLHPWYLLWLLPFAIVVGSRAGYLITVTVLMSYVAKAGQLDSGVWEEATVVRVLEYVPVLGLLLWDTFTARVSEPPAAVPAEPLSEQPSG
ncbi:MAG: hypothetical protein AAF581_01120 [Planctomycetota bacterium]